MIALASPSNWLKIPPSGQSYGLLLMVYLLRINGVVSLLSIQAHQPILLVNGRLLRKQGKQRKNITHYFVDVPRRTCYNLPMMTRER